MLDQLKIKPFTLSLTGCSIDKVMYGLDGQTVNWTENWLNGEAQRVVLSDTESGWRPVTSTAPRGTILGPVPFSMFGNGPDDGAEGASSKFAEDIKMGEVADAWEDCAATQSSIKRWEKWTDGNLMKVTKKKYKVLHLGRNSYIHPCILSVA